MSENLSARERKAAMQKPKKVSRRASPVTVSFLPVTRRAKRNAKARQEVDALAAALSGERESDLAKKGRFIELRPSNVHPWDWHQFYIEDESLWEAIAEEAADAVKSGELPRYDRTR